MSKITFFDVQLPTFLDRMSMLILSFLPRLCKRFNKSASSIVSEAAGRFSSKEFIQIDKYIRRLFKSPYHFHFLYAETQLKKVQ
jgi:hypothetical protein